MLQSLCSTGPPSRVPASRCARPPPGSRAKTDGSPKDRNIVSKPASYPSTNYDFNKLIDNSMGGSSELFRSNEIQLEQLGIAFFPAEPLLCFRSGQSRLTIPYFKCLQTHKYEFSNAHIQR